MRKTKTFDDRLKEFLSSERWEKEAGKDIIDRTTEKYPPEYIEFLIERYKSKFLPTDQEVKPNELIRL